MSSTLRWLSGCAGGHYFDEKEKNCLLTNIDIFVTL
jgi:hypothetical protein